jgi:DNA polymerase type B, organellar and viral
MIPLNKQYYNLTVERIFKKCYLLKVTLNNEITPWHTAIFTIDILEEVYSELFNLIRERNQSYNQEAYIKIPSNWSDHDYEELLNNFNLGYSEKLLSRDRIILKKFTRPSRKIVQVVITEMKYIHDNKQLVFWIDNPGLLSHKAVIKSIFKALKSNKDFKVFGRKKVIIIQALIDGEERSFHQNVIMNNQTTFKKYWSVVKDLITTNYEDGYPLNTINQFKVRVWSMNNVKNKNIKLTQNAIYYRPKSKITVNKRNYSTSTVKQQILPLKNPISLKPQLFMSMDIETMNINGNQIPVLITTHSLNNSKIFMIDKDLLNSNPDLALSKLWDLFFDFLNKQSIKFIFVHNLGKFDGIFIFKYLLNQYKKESIKPIIDQHNAFVSITIKLDNINIKYLDSMRIFPVSLNELCKIFKVEGKTNSYNSEYNNTSLFNNKTLFSEWLNYSKQDSAALFNALVNAQLIYLEKYKIDLTSIVSISSLSFKIFRQDFLNLSIPILNKIQDLFIRKSYIGGATDYYRKFLKKVIIMMLIVYILSRC